MDQLRGMAESEAAASESTSSRGAIGAEPEKSHREGTYAESLKIQRAFLDQNCNTYDEESPFPLRTDLDGEEDAAGNWGTWSPETEKYWTLQYSDAKRVLEVLADEEVDAPVECQRPSNADTLFLIIDEDGADKEIRKKFPGEHGTGPYKPPLPPPQPPNKNRVLRQVSFWVCSRSAQAVVAEFDDPEVRARFTAKVLWLKAVQLLLIFGAIWSMRLSPRLQYLHQTAIFPIWTATVVYVILLLSAKASLLGVTRKGAVILILLQTMCVIEICFAITSNSDSIVIPCILIDISFTYLVIALFCTFFTLDLLNSNNLVTFTWVLVFLSSVGILTFLAYFSGSVAARSLIAIIGHYLLPILLTSETVVLLALTELFQILQGNRIPLLNSRFDWIQATAQLI